MELISSITVSMYNVESTQSLYSIMKLGAPVPPTRDQASQRTTKMYIHVLVKN